MQNRWHVKLAKPSTNMHFKLSIGSCCFIRSAFWLFLHINIRITNAIIIPRYCRWKHGSCSSLAVTFQVISRDFQNIYKSKISNCYILLHSPVHHNMLCSKSVWITHFSVCIVGQWFSNGGKVVQSLLHRVTLSASKNIVRNHSGMMKLGVLESSPRKSLENLLIFFYILDIFIHSCIKHV